ncbi:MAG: hypothetical protein CMF29_00090 [Kiritimatiellaceae bacterium]|nr:hypothetical protein [Kiritimatiellaceae bacterium]
MSKMGLFLMSLMAGMVVSLLADAPYELDAARMIYTNDLIYASGGVTGRFNQAEVRADRIIADPAQGELSLEGNIFFERDVMVWSGDKLTYNYQTEEGDFGPAKMVFGAAQLKADRVERLEKDTFLLKDVRATTCLLEKPHYYLYTSEAILEQDQIFSARHLRVYVGGVPLFYLPYLKGSLDRSGLGAEVGYRGSMGAFSKLNIGEYEGDTWRNRSRLHLYSKRGVGFEQVLNRKTDRSDLMFDGVYLSDEDPYQRYDEPEERAHFDEQRYRIRLQGVHRFSPSTYLLSSWTYLSDRYFVEEFFRDDYRYHAQPETRASFVSAGDYIGFEVYASQRLNDFYSNTDRVEVSIDGYRQQLWSSPFFYENRSAFSYLEQQGVDELAQDNEAFRVWSDHALYYPNRLGALSLVPRVEGGFAYYSKKLDNSSNRERQHWAVGAEASVHASKVISERRRWYGKGLRHVVRPYLDYQRSDYSFQKDVLIPFDVKDTLDDRHRVRMGLNQLFQTKRSNQTKRFAEVDIYTHYLVDETTDDSFDRIYADARMALTDRWHVDGLAVLDGSSGSVPLMISRFRYNRDDVRFSFEHFFRDQIQSLYTARIDLFPGQRYSAEGYVRYEGESQDIESAAITFFTKSCCVRYGLGYRLSRTDDHQIRLSVNLVALNP